jgi:tetratricopeptide (TPR) repeat protein
VTSDTSEILEARVARSRELLTKDPNDEVLWFGLGQALLVLQRADEAVEAFRRSIALRPDYTAAHRDLGRALLAAERAQEAAQALARADGLAARTGDLQTGREIDTYRRRAARAAGLADPAREAPGPTAGDSRGAVGNGSGLARELARKAFRHLANDRLAQAVEGYRRALEEDPSLPIAWNGLSMAYRHLGELDRAIEAAKRLVELEPDDPLSHTNLSILYQNKGMIAEAEDEKALAMRLQLENAP